MSDHENQIIEPEDHGKVVRRHRLRISWIWLFPLLAAAATAWLFWSNWKANGPMIEVEFEAAPGIQAGKTPLLYRGVTAGIVHGVRLDPGLQKVILRVRLKEFAAGLARKGTIFWIDQPVIGLGNTSGLDALIQGNSLQARSGDGPPAFSFVGHETLPLTPLESPALVLKLRAANIPFLDRGSPLYYRGVQVGAVESKALDESGNPYLYVVVEKEFAQTVHGNARFWPVSATSIRIGAGGLRIDLLGLKAILLGGLQFDTFGDPGALVKNGAEFTLHSDETAARATGAPVRISFRDGHGIQAGQTEVRHLGMPIGYVETATLNAANQSVDTTARFQPEYEHLRNTGAVFTLVRPHISLEGVSGLEALAGGPYIDCLPGTGGELADTFEGRTLSDDGWQTAQSEKEGTHIVVQSKNLPAMGKGAPVLYRGLVAGRVEARTISSDGTPGLDVIIRQEYAHTLPRNARFWQVPAVSVQAGPGVLNMDVAGLQALVQGALAYDVFGPAEAPVGDGAKFEIFGSESAARATSPPICITFENGQGLLAGRTEVRYLGQPVGLVESVSPKTGKVEAIIRLNDGYDFLRREGSAFAVMRLNVSLKGISGLETVVSGVYIECVPAASGALRDRFTAVTPAKAALEQKEQRGFEVVITTPGSSIAVGAPVTYRGVVVGKVLRKALANDGRDVGLCVVVDRPSATLIRDNTRFWDASGMKISLGFFNLRVQNASLETLARGGIAFATPDHLGQRVKPGHEFPLNAAPRREWLRWAPAIPTGE